MVLFLDAYTRRLRVLQRIRETGRAEHVSGFFVHPTTAQNILKVHSSVAEKRKLMMLPIRQLAFGSNHVVSKHENKK